MTVKEIAKAVGKDSTVITRWIQKIVHPNFLDVHPKNLDVDMQNAGVDLKKLDVVNSIKLKAGNKDPHNPADYTFEETLLIIETGMGKNAAGVYRASAANAQTSPENNYTALLKDIEHLMDAKIQAALAPVIARNEQKRLPPPPELPDGDKIRAFVEKYLEITGRDAHFITFDDAFTLYQRETGDGIPRNILSYQLLRAYPVLSEKVRKVEHRREKVITGCRPQERLILNGAMFCMDVHYKVMFDD
jgi:hypothetical protein